MNTLFLGKNFVELESTDSTNSFCSALLESNPPEGTVVSARSQTAGRGQKGSFWNAEHGKNLTFSLILYPRFLAPRQVFLLNKLIACALRDLVGEICGQSDALVKWPNDVLFRGRKVAGILMENQIDSSKVRTAVVGIGLNVNQVEFSPEVHGKASSLKIETGADHVLMEILEGLLQRIESRYLALRSGRQDALEMEYLAHLYAYQEMTEVEVGGQKRTVRLVGVDPNGRLAVDEEGKLNYYDVKELKFCL